MTTLAASACRGSARRIRKRVQRCAVANPRSSIRTHVSRFMGCLSSLEYAGRRATAIPPAAPSQGLGLRATTNAAARRLAVDKDVSVGRDMDNRAAPLSRLVGLLRTIEMCESLAAGIALREIPRDCLPPAYVCVRIASNESGHRSGNAALPRGAATATLTEADTWEELEKAEGTTVRIPPPSVAVAAASQSSRGGSDKNVLRKYDANMDGDVEGKQRRRARLLRNANGLHRSLKDLASDCRPRRRGQGVALLRKLNQLLEMERELQRDSGCELGFGNRVGDDGQSESHLGLSGMPSSPPFSVNLGLYSLIMRCLPADDLPKKIEVLKLNVDAIERLNARVLARQELDKGPDEKAQSQPRPDFAIPVPVYLNVCATAGRFAAGSRGHAKRPTNEPRRRLQSDTDALILSMCEYLRDHLFTLDEAKYQRTCLPRLMAAALAAPRQAPLWALASEIFWYLDELDFPYDQATYERVVRLSNYRNASIFPFWKVLQRLSENETTRGHLSMDTLVSLLRNQYPYGDLVATKSIMRIMLMIYGDDGDPCALDDRVRGRCVSHERPDKSSNSSADLLPEKHQQHLYPDRGTLESVAAAAARGHDSDMLLLAWDLGEAAGYEPSDNMYECAIQAFGGVGMQDHKALAVLAEMEEMGRTPSRFVIRSFARYIKRSQGRLKNAYHLLVNGTQETPLTAAGMNCIVAASAMWGDSDGAFSTYRDFQKYGLEPDANTFAFMMEALATEVSRQETKVRLSGDQIHRHEMAADEIMEMAKERKLTSHHLLHQYLRVLCAGGCLEEAVMELKRANDANDYILMESFGMVAVRHAKVGKEKEAYRVANDMYSAGGYGMMPANILGRIRNELRRQRE